MFWTLDLEKLKRKLVLVSHAHETPTGAHKKQSGYLGTGDLFFYLKMTFCELIEYTDWRV